MTFLIGNYEFDGPHESVADLKEVQGIYAVLYLEHDEYELVHLAQAGNVRDRFVVSAAVPSTAGAGKVLVAGCYTPECGARERQMIVEEILCEFPMQECGTPAEPGLVGLLQLDVVARQRRKINSLRLRSGAIV